MAEFREQRIAEGQSGGWKVKIGDVVREDKDEEDGVGDEDGVKTTVVGV